MPKAFTGCTKVFYTLISPKAKAELNRMVKESGVSRAIFSNAMVLEQAQRRPLKLETPEYHKHERVKKSR